MSQVRYQERAAGEEGGQPAVSRIGWGAAAVAFISVYTDKTAISIGMGLLLEEFVHHKLRPARAAKILKQNPDDTDIGEID